MVYLCSGMKFFVGKTVSKAVNEDSRGGGMLYLVVYEGCSQLLSGGSLRS